MKKIVTFIKSMKSNQRSNSQVFEYLEFDNFLCFLNQLELLEICFYRENLCILTCKIYVSIIKFALL